MFQIGGTVSKNFEIYHIFYFILAFLGIYLIFSVYNMKKKEEISPLIIAQEELAKCRDKKGFIEEIAKPLLALGIVSLSDGAFGIVNSLVIDFGWGYELFGITIFMIFYGWFSRELRKGINKYFK